MSEDCQLTALQGTHFLEKAGSPHPSAKNFCMVHCRSRV